MFRWRRTIPWLLFAVALMLSVLLLVQTYNRQKSSQAIPEVVAGRLGQTVTSGFSNMAAQVKDFFIWLANWRQLALENQNYRNQVADLTAQVDRLSQLQEENDQYRQALQYKQNNLNFDSVYGRVIATTPGAWLKEFTVDRGSDDGVAPNMVVVNIDGLVGRVVEVGKTYCKVATIMDPRVAVSVIVERSRDECVLKGVQDADAANPLCTMMYLPFNADVVPGDTILTSDLTGAFPKGLAVGTVIEAAGGKTQGQYAVVAPFVDFGHIKDVLILTGFVPETNDALE